MRRVAEWRQLRVFIILAKFSKTVQPPFLRHIDQALSELSQLAADLRFDRVNQQCAFPVGLKFGGRASSRKAGNGPLKQAGALVA
jgi:hypothetical protein